MTYRELPQSVQVMLEDYCRIEGHGLRPSVLYQNIVETLQTNSVAVTAVLYELSISLVWMIRESSEKNPSKGLTSESRPYII